jgi:hypothetical protein
VWARYWAGGDPDASSTAGSDRGFAALLPTHVISLRRRLCSGPTQHHSAVPGTLRCPVSLAAAGPDDQPGDHHQAPRRVRIGTWMTSSCWEMRCWLLRWWSRAAQRAVMLPPGGWYNFWDDQFSGPGEAEMKRRWAAAVVGLRRLPARPDEATRCACAPPATQRQRSPACKLALKRRWLWLWVGFHCVAKWAKYRSTGKRGNSHPDMTILPCGVPAGEPGWIATAGNRKSRLTCGRFDQNRIRL